MVGVMCEMSLETPTIDISHNLMDDLRSAKQKRLLVCSLYADWQIGLPFLAEANVGIFSTTRESPVVPDLFVSLNVRMADDWHVRRNRAYFLWEYCKQPEIVLEIVSDCTGGEPEKQLRYARMGIDYYAIYDPQRLIQDADLRIFRLWRGGYVPQTDLFLDAVGLGLTLWQGEFEQTAGTWLRWVDVRGAVLLTGAERLRALGVDPDLVE